MDEATKIAARIEGPHCVRIALGRRWGTRGITHARGGIRNALLTPPNPPPLYRCPRRWPVHVSGGGLGGAGQAGLAAAPAPPG